MSSRPTRRIRPTTGPIVVLAHASRRLLDAAPHLEDEGDFLVLFQTVASQDLPRLAKLAPAAASSRLAYDDAFVRRLAGVVGGTPITCGSLVGRWSPSVPR